VTDIARPLFLENLLVVGAGAAGGLLLATPLLGITTRLMPSWMALLKPAAVDARVVWFTALMAACATVLASLWPVWRAVRVPTMPHLTEGARGSHRVMNAGRFIVVAGQIAIGLTLTLGGALLITSLAQVRRIDPGYAADEVIVLMGRTVPATRADRDLAIERFSKQVQALPGVMAVGVTQSRFGSMMMNAFTDGATMAVTPGFYEAMGLRLVAGRWMTAEELTSGAAVAVMTVRSANKAFPGASAVGKQIRGFVSQKPQSFDVIGVVEDVRLVRWDDGQVGQVFSPYSLVSDEQTTVSVVVRTSDPKQLSPTLVALARTPDPDSVRVISASTGLTLLNESIRTRRMNSWIFGGFAAAALVIVGVGMLGLMAMSSSTRTREIGIRMALGSTRAGVVQLLLREQMLAVIAGLIGGGLLSAWSLKFVKTYLFSISGSDPRVWTVAVAVMLTVALIGAAIPSLRASRIDPARALQPD
jgi:putative ABC transport system permease protein